ncbi:hypothetical protein DK871_29160 [Pseudomonas sp. L13]|nr:hypothetical protein [Pseudomonas sp. L13]
MRLNRRRYWLAQDRWLYTVSSTGDVPGANFVGSTRPLRELACDSHRYLHNCAALNGNHDAKRVALDLLLICF